MVVVTFLRQTSIDVFKFTHLASPTAEVIHIYWLCNNLSEATASPTHESDVKSDPSHNSYIWRYCFCFHYHYNMIVAACQR